MYDANFKQPRQYIHVQPFMSKDVPDYDLDNEDIQFFNEELRSKRNLDVTEIVFEDIMDKLEKNSTTYAVTLKEAKFFLKEDDDLILLVYDYWLNKRLSLGQQGLVPAVRTVNTSLGPNPYVCFRRRTEKMMTRKNRKNEEASYESMIKLRRDLTKAVTLLEMVKRREKTKKEKLNLTLDIFDKRYAVGDFNGLMLDTATTNLARSKSTLSAINIQNWISLASPPPRRTYKTRKKYYRNGLKHFNDGSKTNFSRGLSPNCDKFLSSEDEMMNNVDSDEECDTSPFTFIRREGVQYRAPLDTMLVTPDESPNYPEAFHLTSLQGASNHHLGYCRRRLGRGGRVVLDRISTKFDQYLDANRDCPDDPWIIRPLTPANLEEDMDWDPYMVRDKEESNTEPVTVPGLNKINNNSNVFKIVDMNSAVAHNAAGALVDSQFVDLFSTPQLPSGS